MSPARPRGVISYDLRSTQSRQAVHMVTVIQADALPAQPGILTPRTDILPFIGRTGVGIYKFAVSGFLNEQTRALGIIKLNTDGLPLFDVFFDPFTSTPSNEIDVRVYDALGAPVDLVQGQGFNLSMLVRDS